MLISLIKQISPFCKENPKPTSSKVYDSLREKVPKAIADNTYCAVFWYVLQDLCARVGNQNAAWLSNGGDFAAANLPLAVTLDLLEQVLPACGDVVLNRVEFASLLQYIVTAWVATHSQLLPAAVELLKTEETALETLLPLLRVLRTLCGSFFTVLPGVESVLAATTSCVKKLAKKKLGAAEGAAVVEFVLALEQERVLVAYCMTHYMEVGVGVAREA